MNEDQEGQRFDLAAAKGGQRPMNAIWILGATGRIGRAVAARLVADGQSLVLVGRDAARLARVAEKLGCGATISVFATIAEMAEAITKQQPAIVLNLVGPFTQTALPIATACPPGTHYVDLSNEFPSVCALLGLHNDASRAGSTFVTGAGFGVLATESVILKLCEGEPPACFVRCAAVPAVATEPGRLGEAFASAITQGLAFGGRRYKAGQLVRMPLLGDFERVALPNGRVVGTGGAPSAELEAARRASGAPSVVAATSMVPSSAVLRGVLPALLAVMKIPVVRRFCTRKIAAIEVKPTTATAPQISWSYARVQWPSGVTRQGWMRTGDAMVFTSDVMARVALRLISGEGKPGVYTPGALFGAELASECGGKIILELSQ
jgi:short subunit dehydrogenase-like uncharacterized protein